MATRVVRQDEKGLYINGDGEKCRPTNGTAAKVGERVEVSMTHGMASTIAWVKTGKGEWQGDEAWANEWMEG